MPLKEHKLQKDNSETDFLLEKTLCIYGPLGLHVAIFCDHYLLNLLLSSPPYQKSRVALHNESGPSSLAWSFTRC